MDKPDTPFFIKWALIAAAVLLALRLFGVF